MFCLGMHVTAHPFFPMRHNLSEYDCLYRFLGRCPSCVKRADNIYCSDYYPARVLGRESLVQCPERSREIISELESKLLGGVDVKRQ